MISLQFQKALIAVRTVIFTLVVDVLLHQLDQKHIIIPGTIAEHRTLNW